MKKMKKIIALVLAMIMVLAMSVTAFAATVTLPGDGTILKDHSFEAFQVFAGDEDNGVLSNIEWGSNIDNNNFLIALKDTDNAALLIKDTSQGAGEDDKVNAFLNCETAADVAKVLDENYSNTALAEAVAKIAYTCKTGQGVVLTAGTTTLADGYYLIVDTTSNVGEGSAYNAALLQVVGNVDVQVKTGVPQVEKKVKDTNDSQVNSTTDWQDSADYDIGDDVPFQLKSTLPNNVSVYDTYKLVFHDTLSEGLTYNKNAVVRIDGNEVDSNQYDIECTTNDQGITSLTITFNNVLEAGAQDSSVVTVEYTAKLNNKGEIGSTGNPNEVYLTYSNNPNDAGEGTTPKDKVIVFTYKVVVNKVNEEGDPLLGAGFTLYKKNSDGNYEPVGGELTGNAMTQFTWSGLDDGDYKLSETTTPAGYNTIDDILFTVTAEHEILSDSPTLTSLSGNVSSGEATFTSNSSAGSLTTNVENKSGAILPETGGIGTTIFYVVGAILMIGAGVLLITRKRISK